jgi:hypothetical protein
MELVSLWIATIARNIRIRNLKEERSSLQKDRRLIDIQESTDLRKRKMSD